MMKTTGLKIKHSWMRPQHRVRNSSDQCKPYPTLCDTDPAELQRSNEAHLHPGMEASHGERTTQRKETASSRQHRRRFIPDQRGIWDEVDIHSQARQPFQSTNRYTRISRKAELSAGDVLSPSCRGGKSMHTSEHRKRS